MAKALKRKPGAGFHIMRGPKRFQEAIRSYLTRLGRRRDRGVLGGDHHIAGALEAAVDHGVLDVDDFHVAAVLLEHGPDVLFHRRFDLLAELVG